ncbi:MAG: hypothetical protein KatS3mg080_0606 [Anoxybacillus sp.]|nr:MAG: hypothetical protein KatS3mg080_0606 [Anoxybacillus sp.]
MKETNRSIPRPLVRANQWFIVVSVVATWLSGQEWLLAFPLAAGLLGLFFDFNPVMRLAKLFLKKHPSEYVPEKETPSSSSLINSLLSSAFLSA